MRKIYRNFITEKEAQDLISDKDILHNACSFSSGAGKNIMSKVIGMDGGKRPEPGFKIDAADLKDICCENCGGKYFRQVQGFKRLSALISPTGKEQIVPMPTFRCDDCGHVNKAFLPK